MAKLIEGLLSKINQVREDFSSNKNIIKIGLGLKEVAGLTSNEIAFRFYVGKKLQKENITAKDLIPSRLHGVSTDVIEMGNNQSIASVSTSPAVNQDRYRRQGIRGGVCIRNEHFGNRHPSGYGTLGILARRISDNAMVGLTCAHVANSASGSPTELNTKIGHPRYWTSCCCLPAGWIGDIIASTLEADLDCALIQLDQDIIDKVNDPENATENKIIDFENDIVGAALPVLGSFVKKYGQASGLTEGRVVDIAFGSNQMVIKLVGGEPGDSFAHHGDSGAVIVNETDQIVGLLVAAWQEEVGSNKKPLTQSIATFIKPIMEELDISIAGVTADQVVTPIASNPWIGGQDDPSLNPIELITSNDMGFSGIVDWDISTGLQGAEIIETGQQIAIGRSEISIRYNSVSASSRNMDAVIIKATKGEIEEKRYRTVVKITPELNIENNKQDENELSFMNGGGFNIQTGVFTTDNDFGASSLFLAKAEIIYNILPNDVQWFSQLDLEFVFSSSAGLLGQIISRRETKFSKGRQSLSDPHRIHTEQDDWVLVDDGNMEDTQFPSDDQRAFLFRMGNHYFDPSVLKQAYDRTDYRDYLAMYIDNQWLRITPYASWHVNLTADPDPDGGAPLVGEKNEIGLGESTELIPNEPPVITLPNTEIESEPGQAFDLEVIIEDPNNDNVIIEWELLNGPDLGWTDNKIIGNPINIPANSPEGRYEFKIIGDDGTGNLIRTRQNNINEDELNLQLEIAEWKQRYGGQAEQIKNETEEFSSADFGWSGPMDWDVTTGTINADIIEIDGTPISSSGTATNANSIKVRYNNHSSDGTRDQAVVIKITDPAHNISIIRRRTVMLVTMTLRNTGTIEQSPEFEDFQTSKDDAGTISLGPLPIGTGRPNLPGYVYTHASLVVGEITGYKVGTLFRWIRTVQRRCWNISLNASRTSWIVTQRSRKGTITPADDTGSPRHTDNTPSINHNRIYSFDTSANAPVNPPPLGSLPDTPPTIIPLNIIGINGFIYEEKHFDYIIHYQEDGSWKYCSNRYMGHELIMRRIGSGLLLNANWLGVRNTMAWRSLNITITQAKVRALLLESVVPGGLTEGEANLPINIHPNANI